MQGEYAKRKKFYCAGPMRGYPQFNFPKFDAACKRIREAGHIAIGPQELDRLCGIDENTLTDGDITDSMIRSFFHRDLTIIMTEADAIAVLNGWEKSSGALAEVALARTLRLPIYDEYLNPIKLHIEIRSETHDRF